jgi:dolichyl-phosphate beta-glucosyltransferase
VIQQAQIEGFGFDVELLFLAERAGLRMLEVPVRWDHHEGSKVHILRDSLRMFREVVTLRRRVAREGRQQLAAEPSR